MSISNSEMKLMEIIWSRAPIKSGELVSLAFNKLGWKKSTVYTVIKKLTLKGIIRSENAVITSICSRNEILAEGSEDFISKFSGSAGNANSTSSLPIFLTAFLRREKLTKAEAEELKKLIDDYTEEN